MEKSDLNHYVIHHVRSIEKHLKTYNKKQDPDALHDLRVDIKKLRALFSFAVKVYNKPYFIKDLTSLFYAAGIIRETQLHIVLVKNLVGFPKKMINTLQEKESELKLEFLRDIPDYENDMEKFIKAVSLPSKLPSEKIISNYFTNEIRSANKKFRKKTRLELHAFRKKIKKIMYVHNFLPKKNQKLVALNIKSINEFQEKVGKWHDTNRFVTFLTQQASSKTLRPFIKALEEKEKKQFKACYTKRSLTSILEL